MQNDSFKRFSKDLQEVLAMPANFLNRQAKKISLTGDKKKKSSQSQASGAHSIKKTAVDSCSLRDFSASDDGTSDDKHLPTLSVANGLDSGKSLNPLSPGAGKVFPREESPIIHCPPSISAMDQFSPQRRAWIQTWGQHNVNTELSNVLKSGHAWDSVDPNQSLTKSAYVSTPIEAAGLLFVKLMQVTNRATSKIFDVEWSLRVGNVERTSYPTRSYKDNTGNTATMNEIFLFDVNEPFQLEMTVTGNPVPTKFGTMAGFSNHLQTLGQLDLSFCLETMDKSVRTYKLRRPIPEDSSKAFKSDCEVVVMIGLHVLEEPIEDRSWETEVLYQGFLTFMTRGGRMTSWKRYWAVLEGRTLKLYDAEYQLKRDVVGVVPLAYVQGVEPPDYDKVDVVANAFSILVDPNGVDMAGMSSYVEQEELDYSLYAYTDSAHLHEVWNAHLEEALDQYQGNMGRRGEIQRAKMARRASQSLSRHSFESSMPPSPLDSEEGGSSTTGMIDARFVW